MVARIHPRPRQRSSKPEDQRSSRPVPKCSMCQTWRIRGANTKSTRHVLSKNHPNCQTPGSLRVVLLLCFSMRFLCCSTYATIRLGESSFGESRHVRKGRGVGQRVESSRLGGESSSGLRGGSSSGLAGGSCHVCTSTFMSGWFQAGFARTPLDAP